MHRRSGLLLHITSLPSRFGIGDLGPAAYKFADTLAAAGQTIWQVLPLGPLSAWADFSPYSCTSAFAGNELLISPELLVQDGLLQGRELASVRAAANGPVEFIKARELKFKLLEAAFARFKPNSTYELFCRENAFWLEDFALFSALVHHWPMKSWAAWPRELRDRRPAALKKASQEFAEGIARIKFQQYVFFSQLRSLRMHCNARSIQLFGDMPLYVAYESADVWAHGHNFQLDRDKRPRAVAGMPASRFNEEGQLWGMPLFAWGHLRSEGYEWWVQRIAQSLQMFNWLRIDHFLGLVRYWRIPAGSASAMVGRWVHGPGEDFFKTLYRRISQPALVAEDLGYVSAESREIMSNYNIMGMRILMDAFGGGGGLSRFLPHNYPARCVVYTGTHDNNTVRGWFEHAPAIQRQHVFQYVGRRFTAAQVHWEIIRLAMESVAQVAIYPAQDVLGLAEQARMNVPGTPRGNWRWRLKAEQLQSDAWDKLHELSQTYGRD